jgi:predicted phosphodiesterase
MRIGVITDTHDDTAKLARALAALRADGVDAIVSLGDTSDLHGKWQNVGGVASLLKEYGVVGVWGNHDHGLCRDVSDEARAKFDAASLAYMATMQPRLSLGGCHFTHVEPWLDPESVADMWLCSGRPDEPERLAKSFAAFSERVAFTGHFHHWRAMDEGGRIEWDGTSPLRFEDGKRYLVVVGPLFAGAFATVDTDSWRLTPHQLP